MAYLVKSSCCSKEKWSTANGAGFSRCETLEEALEIANRQAEQMKCFRDFSQEGHDWIFYAQHEMKSHTARVIVHWIK